MISNGVSSAGVLEFLQSDRMVVFELYKLWDTSIL